jgi:hypothetical protein
LKNYDCLFEKLGRRFLKNCSRLFENEVGNPVQAIINHMNDPDGGEGDYLYLVHRKGYDDPSEHIWVPPTNLDDRSEINIYWNRLRNGTKSTRAQTKLPKTVNKRTKKRRLNRRSATTK